MRCVRRWRSSDFWTIWTRAHSRSSGGRKMSLPHQSRAAKRLRETAPAGARIEKAARGVALHATSLNWGQNQCLKLVPSASVCDGLTARRN